MQLSYRQTEIINNFYTSTKAIWGTVWVTPPIHIPYFPKDFTVKVVDNYLTPREEMPRTIRDNLQSLEHRIYSSHGKQKEEWKNIWNRRPCLSQIATISTKNYSTHNFPKTGIKRPYLVLERIGSHAGWFYYSVACNRVTPLSCRRFFFFTFFHFFYVLFEKLSTSTFYLTSLAAHRSW